MATSNQWFHKLGFNKYPLDPRSNPNLVAVDTIEKKMISYIQQGNMCLLCGFTGSGKTSMLMRLMDHPELPYEFVHISADGIKKDKDIQDLINDKRSIISRLFKRMKNMVILLDESQVASRILTESIKSKWNETYPTGEKVIQSVVVCQIEPRLQSNFSGSFMDRLGKRILKMKKLEPTELKEVLSKRLKTKDYNYINKFEKEALDFLVQNCGGSVRQLLEYTDVIFRELNSIDEESLLNKKFKISKENIMTFLQDSQLTLSAKKSYKRLLSSEKFTKSLEMFEQFGALTVEKLAEKLDITKRNAQGIIRDLLKNEAIIISHTEDKIKYYIMTPRVKQEMVKA